MIEIKELVKQHYGHGIIYRKKSSLRAVDRVSFGIKRNTIFGLVGESGCGKTTLARAVLYLDPPSSGEVWFDGTLLGSLSLKELRSFRKRMQIVFQDPISALDPKMNIQKSLEEGLVNRRIAPGLRKKRIKELLELVGIAPFSSARYPHEFSGGQKQRIVIARALSMEPDFLVLDEPVSNLDVSIQAQIINLLLDLKEELSLTYLFISHDLHLVAYISDRIAVMYQGRIVELASTDEMINHPLHPYTLRLFSSVPGHGSALDKGKAIDHAEQGSGRIGCKEDRTGAALKGCHYFEYCTIGDFSCKEREPELKDIGGGHLVACFKI